MSLRVCMKPLKRNIILIKISNGNLDFKVAIFCLMWYNEFAKQTQ